MNIKEYFDEFKDDYALTFSRYKYVCMLKAADPDVFCCSFEGGYLVCFIVKWDDGRCKFAVHDRDDGEWEIEFDDVKECIELFERVKAKGTFSITEWNTLEKEFEGYEIWTN